MPTITGIASWVATRPNISSGFSGMAIPLRSMNSNSSVPSSKNSAITKNCIIPLTIMFFWLCLESLQARLRCIMSWSRPFVAIAMNTPAMNCFQKYEPLLGSSKKNIRDVWWLLMASVISPKEKPRFAATKYMHSITDIIRQKLLSVSVQIRVLTPPCTVYSQIRAIVTITLNTNGIPSGENTSNCSTAHTTKNLTAAPSIFDAKKNHAPVRYVDCPKRSPRYPYIERRLRL